jgi:alpha-amylase
MVKGYGGWMVRSIQELRALRGSTSFKPYAVGECWDSERTIDDWLDEINAWSDNPVGAFDFPLRWRLRDLCDSYGFSLRNLADRGVLMWDRPEQAVTFVENHDVVRDSPIINDKLLAYAFILTHEGYPCVFWQDYFNWDLAQPNLQRSGAGDQNGLICVLNNRDVWNGTWVQTRWNNARLVPAAWRGRDDLNVPEQKWTNESGWVDLWAPPRGYVVYVPG